MSLTLSGAAGWSAYGVWCLSPLFLLQKRPKPSKSDTLFCSETSVTSLATKLVAGWGEIFYVKGF